MAQVDAELSIRPPVNRDLPNAPGSLPQVDQHGQCPSPTITCLTFSGDLHRGSRGFGCLSCPRLLQSQPVELTGQCA